MAILPERLDVTLAFKAIGLLETLSGTDKRVAIAIIDSFNRTTGQCDPGLGRIAHLLGVSRRTVIRSIPRLESARVLTRSRYCGNSHRNSYQPNWAYFRQTEERWSARKKTKHWSRAPQQEVSPSESNNCHSADAKAVTQTNPINPSKETRHPSPTIQAEHRDQLRRQSNAPSGLRIATSPSHREVSHAAAERRWTTELNRRFAREPDAYALLLEAIDPALQRAATEAEYKCAGAGIRLVLAHVTNVEQRSGDAT